MPRSQDSRSSSPLVSPAGERAESPSEVTRAELLEYFSSFLTTHRRQRFAEVLAQRTRRLAVVLDEVHDRHNISAVLRSCDAFGLQDVYVIDADGQFEANAEIALGCEQWLTLRHFSGAGAAARCLDVLHEQGYSLAATAPCRAETRPVDELPIDRKWAIVFGNERLGVSRIILERAAQRVGVPMFGFVESLNISAAAAICLQSLSSRLRRAAEPWALSEEEQLDLLYDWTRLSTPSADALERRFREERSRAGR